LRPVVRNMTALNTLHPPDPLASLPRVLPTPPPAAAAAAGEGRSSSICEVTSVTWRCVRDMTQASEMTNENMKT
jgi:hypothetical protein